MRPYGQGILKNSKIYFCSLGSDEHRSFLFWPLCVGHYYCDGDYIVKRQNYNSFLVLYVIRGSLYVENLQHGGRSIVEPGGFAILDCYKPHCYGSTTGCEILWAHFDGPEARHYYDFMTMTRSDRPMISGSSEEIRMTPSPCLAKRMIIW